jgi:hypothetical protein
MNLKTGILFVSAATLLFASCSRAGTVYNLGGQWSNSSNPNGVWTYREGTSALPLVPHFNFGGTIPGFTAQPAWAPSNSVGSFLPVWLQSSQTGTPAGFQPGAVLPGDVIVHSTDNANGSGHGIANVIWTSPSAGTIDIIGDIWWVRNISGRANDFSISVGGTVIADGVISDGSIYTRANPLEFSSGVLAGDSLDQIAVSAGETVELAVTEAPSSPFGEIDGVNLQITQSSSTTTPEPGSVLLLGFGLVALAALRKASGSGSGC